MKRLITGAHTIIGSTDADADRAFFRDVLGFDSVDAGGGWLIFALPPAEVAIHPGKNGRHDLYLMCADLDATLTELKGKGVKVKPRVYEEPWGTPRDDYLAGWERPVDLPTEPPEPPSQLTPATSTDPDSRREFEATNCASYGRTRRRRQSNSGGRYRSHEITGGHGPAINGPPYETSAR